MNVYENLENYKLSRFVRLHKKPDCCFVYNSQNGIKAKIYDKELLDQIEILSSGETLREVDERLLTTEICVKEFIDEEAVVLNKIKSTLTANTNTLRLIVLPTRDCNFDCVYCYEGKRKEIMSDDTASDLIEATKKYMEINKTIESLQLEWFGGEPLLCYTTILRISSELHEYCETNKKNFFMSMTTNGYLLTPERARELLKYNCISYQITVDGNSEHHDKLRVLRNGGPTWNVIYSNLLAIKNEINDSSLKIRIRINYHADMLINIEDFLKKIKADFNDPRFNIYMIKINPPSDKTTELNFVPNRAEVLAQDYIFDLFNDNEISIAEYVSNINPLSPLCYARQNSIFVVDVDGTVRKCTEYLDDNGINNIGTIIGGIFNINEQIHAQWLMPNNKLVQNRGCYECVDMPVCFGGVCPMQWFRDKDISCNMFHLLTDKMLEIYFAEKGRETGNQK